MLKILQSVEIQRFGSEKKSLIFSKNEQKSGANREKRRFKLSFFEKKALKKQIKQYNILNNRTL